MVTINFLDWRQQSVSYQLKILQRMMSVSAGLAVLFLVAWHMQVMRSQEKWQQRLEVLEQIQKSSDMRQALYLKSNAMANSEMKSQLLTQQRAMLKFFHQLSLPFKAPVCLDKIEHSTNNIVIFGKSHTISDLFLLIKSWQAQHLFNHVLIEEIKKTNHVVLFRLRITEENAYAKTL
jgi:hypothetical protein